MVMDEFISTGAAAPAVSSSGHGHGQEPAATGSSGASSSSHEELIARMGAHQEELERLGDEMYRIQELRQNEKKRIHELKRQLAGGRKDEDEDEYEGNEDDDAIVNYFGKFKWTERLKEQMKTVFGIRDFRLVQEGCVLSWRPPESPSRLTQ